MSFENSIFSDVKKFYLVFLDIAVYISSFLFFTWGLSIFFFGIKNFENIFLVFLIISGLLYLFRESKKIQKIRNFLRKTITILGSIFVLILFLNLYLKISNSLNSQFLTTSRELESLLNQFVIIIVCAFAFGLLYFFIAFHILALILSRIKTEKKKQYLGIFVIIILCLSPFIYIYSILTIKGFSSSLKMFIYSKLNWILGFSLISLHLNHLIKEVKKGLKTFPHAGYNIN